MDKEIKLNNVNNKVNNDYDGEAIDKVNEKIDLEKEGSNYMSGQLCQLVDLWELNNKKKKKKKRKLFKLQTPFGLASVTLKRRNEIIFGKLKYKEIAKNITKNNEANTKNIEIIHNYLNIPSDENIKSIEDFNRKVEVKPEYLELKSRKEFETLSAILMLSDPYRFKDGGGFARGAIRKAYDDINKGDDKALIKIFGDGGDKFKSVSEADYIPAQYDDSKKPGNRDKRRKTSGNLGGVRRTLHVLKFAKDNKYDKKEYNEKQESIENNKGRFAKFNKYVSPNKTGHSSNNNRVKISLDEEKEKIKKKYQNGEINIYNALYESEIKLPKESKMIGRKIFRSKPKDKNTNVNIKTIKKKKI